MMSSCALLEELSIVLPCHDEAENVERVVLAACRAAASVADSWEWWW